MKKVHGIWLPEADEHFEKMMAKEPLREYNGRPVGVYQSAKLGNAVGLAKDRRAALDIGAHVGLWSMWLAKAFVTVHAFEPLPEHAACWRRNLEGVGNATLRQAAVGEAPGWTRMAVDASNSGKSCVAGSGEQVQVVAIDGLDLGPVDLIKIDTEGFEASVIKGAAATILRYQPVIVVESNGQHERYGLPEPVGILESMGAVVLERMRHDVIMGWPDAD